MIKPAPVSLKEKLKWLGPGITWMAAGAGGAGELLFPPRVGSLYGYTFLWALLLAILLKWFINREIGRYAVCTGSSILAGFNKLPGFGAWALWIIIVPQLFVAVGSIAGIAGSAATAFILLLPGSVKLWTAVTLITSVILLTTGSYKLIEKVAMFFAIALGIVGITTAISVFPQSSQLAEGMIPQLPSDVDYVEIIPWLSFLLAGAAGMTWYSYWIPAKGYGAAGVKDVHQAWQEKRNIKELRGWLKEMTFDNTLGVIGGLLIVVAFLILGAELLGPQQLVPEENKIAAVLGKLLESNWGRAGFWAMVGGVLIGFWNTAMTNQDGWARLFSNGISILLTGKNVDSKWRQEDYLRKRILWIVLTIIPIVAYLLAGEPVGLLKAAGIIEAIHIPIIAGLTLYMNVKILPEGLKPSKATLIVNVVACLFFIGFASLYVIQLFKR
jgi:Mn2+/Fe2+ NRAMP family transporter